MQWAKLDVYSFNLKVTLSHTYNLFLKHPAFNRKPFRLFFYSTVIDFLTKKRMNMKSIIMALFCAYATNAAVAQISDAEAEAMANLLMVQKREAVSKLVFVSGKDSAAFWKIYDDYQNKNRTTTKSRIKLYQQTAFAYSNLTPATADSLALKYFENRDSQEKMLEDYYKKVKAATNATVAFQFYQAEVYLITQIRASIMQQIPTYGQVQLAAKKKE
jgi:hypothetical protein